MPPDVENRLQFLLSQPVEVITDKSVPPGADPRDYRSLAIYWWPHPVTKIPYYPRDGIRNPEADQYDSPRLKRMVSTISDLTAFYVETGDATLAENIRTRIHAWFLDEDTRMNPSMQHAQFIPGINDGSCYGLIEGVKLASSFLDAINLLERYGGIDSFTLDGLRRWFSALAEWYRTSPRGQEAGNLKNNHSLWYDYQVIRYSEFSGDTETAREVLLRVGSCRIARQIHPDGSMPKELARTRSYEYTCYALDALMHLAEAGQRYGVNIVDYVSPEGASLEQALTFTFKHVAEDREWPGQQIVPLDPAYITRIVRRYVQLRPDSPLATLLASYTATKEPTITQKTSR